MANRYIYSSKSGEILIRGIGLLVISYKVNVHFCRRFAGEFQGPGRCICGFVATNNYTGPRNI